MRFCHGFSIAASVLATAPAFAGVPAMQIATAPSVSPSAALAYYGSPASPTPAAARDPLVQERARALNYDIDLIYRSIRDNVDTVSIFGMQKGARGVVLDNSGTAFDQAHAMVEMLREADAVAGKGYNPSYRYGTITLSGAEFASWFGISNADAARAILADGGIPATVTSAGSVITSVAMAHIWVDATIDGMHYLFDPSFKPSNFTSRIDLAAAMGFNGADLRAAGESGATVTSSSIRAFNQPAFRAKLDQYRASLETHLNANFRGRKIEDVVGGRAISASPPTELRRSTLPYVTSVDRSWGGNIPDIFRVSLTVSLNGSAYGTYFADDIYGTFKAFRYYNGSSGATKGVVLDKITGIAEECDFYNAGAPAQPVTATVAINHAYAALSGAYMDRTLSKSIVSNQCTKSFFYLTNDWGRGSGQIGRKLALPAISYLYQPYNGELRTASAFSAISEQYTRYLDLASAELGVSYQLHDMIGIHHVDRVGLITKSVNGSNWFEQGSEQQMITTDYEGALSVNPVDAVSSARRDAAVHVATAGLDFVENGALRQQTDTVRDITPITLFTGQNSLATAPGNYAYHLATSANWSTVRDTQLANYPVTLKTILNNYIAEGYSLMLPERGDLRQQPFYVDMGSGSVRSTRLVETYAGTADLVRPVFYAYKPQAGGVGAAAYLIFDPRRGRVLKGGVSVSLIDSVGTALKNPEGPVGKVREPLRSQIAIDGKTGGMTYSPDADLSDGFGDFPYRLELKRQYSGGDSTDYGLGMGWRHNWIQVATSANDGNALMGRLGAQGAAASLVAIWATNDLMLAPPTPTRLVGLAHTEKWLADQAIDNVVTISRGLDGDVNFLRQSGGGFVSAKPDGSVLTQTGVAADSIINRRTYENVSYNYDASDGSRLSYAFVGMSNVEPAHAVQVSANARKTLYLSDWTMPDGFKISTSYIYRFDVNLVYFQQALNSLGRSITNGKVDLGDWGDHATCTGANSLITWLPARSGETTYLTSGGAIVKFYKTASNQWIARPNDDGDPPVRCTQQGTVGNIFVVHPSTMTSVVDAAGNGWGYGMGPVPNPYLNFPAITKIFKPSRPTIPALEIVYGNDSNVRTVKDARANNFSYRSTPNRAESADPSGSATAEYFDQFGRRVVTVNQLGNVTRYAYDARDLMIQVTYPELNSTTYAYDARSNQISTTNWPKPGSPTPAVTTLTTYVEGPTVLVCGNLKTCNRPLQSTDGRGAVTDYEWDSLTGLLKSATSPPDDNGVRPKSTYGYSFFTGAGGENFPLPTSVQQRITATASTTSTYAYDPSSKYALKDVTVDNPGLSLRSCLKFDPAGNLEAVTAPNAGLGNCP